MILKPEYMRRPDYDPADKLQSSFTNIFELTVEVIE